MSREMKDSNVEWIGGIPQHWKKTTVKNYYEVLLGKMLQPLPKSENDTLEYYLKAQNIQWNNIITENLNQMWFSKSEKDKFRLNHGDLIVSEGGDVGKAAIWNGEVKDVYIQNAVHRIRGNHAKFLYYWLFFTKHIGYIDTLCNKSTLMHLTSDKLKNLVMVLPEENEQGKIVSYLDFATVRIDSIINRTKETICDYKVLKQAIITETVMKGLNKNVKMKDSGVEWIGEIPSTWKYGRIKYNTFVKGRIGWQGLRADEFIDEGPFLVTGIHFENNRVKWESCYHITRERYNEAPEIHLRKNDLLMTKDGTIGKVAFISDIPSEATLNSHLLLIRPTNTLYHNHYMMWLLLSDSFIRYYELHKYGTIMDSISQEQFKEFSFYCPSTIEEQLEISAYLDKKCLEIDSLISQKLKLVEEMEAYKKSLIYECVTGKREVN